MIRPLAGGPHRSYAPSVKTIWTGRMTQAAAKYGEVAPTATVCCNACRTCVQTNLLGIVMAGIAAAGVGVTRLLRRVLANPS
jgi:hypothetical protein